MGPRALVRRLFLWALALVYLDAFLSLLVQVRGLVGARGILPAAELLDYVARRFPEGSRFWLLPTVFWIDSGDGALIAVCVLGAALALALALEAAPAVVLLLLWVAYLSLSCVGQVFLGYQWDALLLETGLLAVLLAPWSLRPRAVRAAPVPREAVWLFRLLVFRLNFGSGLVKLLSGDPAWRSLAALRYHYETQPLPTWIGYYAGHLPELIQVASAGILFFLELVVPFFVFGPRLLRQGAFCALAALQAGIALTGNYGFFNLLAIALCLLLLDDDDLPRRLRAWLPARPELPERGWERWLRWPASAALGLLAVMTFLGGTGVRVPWPAPALALQRAADPFGAVNFYGLFAVMTTTRPEILVEGSRDGQSWQAYEFRWKPGDVTRRPGFVAPHQPRLDWQMWFAALQRCEDNPWFWRFLERLREGEPSVRELLAHDPFGDPPPAYVRAELFDYRFSSLAEHRATGAWWARRPLGPYCPPR